MSQINVPVLPSAVLRHARVMEQLQQQVAQHQAIMSRAVAPIHAANVAINACAAQLTRAHVYLVEQYNKTPKAKAKRAHAALVEVCQLFVRRAAMRKSLHQVAAEFAQQVVADVRAVMRELLQEHHANAPNGCADLFMTNQYKAANTNA